MSDSKETLHHIELSKTGLGISGGETCLLELVNSFNGKFNQIVYVPENGKEVYKRNKINAKYIVISPFWIEKIFGVYISYFLRTLLSFFKVPKFKNKENIIISHSDFFPTVIYALLIKLRNPKAKWIVFMHMIAPPPLRGYKGEFTNEYNLPTINIISYNISQLIFKFLTRWKADKIIFVTPYYKKYIEENNLQKKSIIIKLGDIGNNNIRSKIAYHKNSKIVYDSVFLGRFHPQKGLFDLIDIWALVVKHHKNAKLAIIGSGEKSFENKLKNEIEKRNLIKNIALLGFKEGNEKFEILKSSKIFLFPSYFESFGIVAVEAMSYGLPVVAYDLPVYEDLFVKGMIKVPIKDKDKFARSIINLLDNKQYYKKIRKEAIELSQSFSWKRFSQRIIMVINEINGD